MRLADQLGNGLGEDVQHPVQIEVGVALEAWDQALRLRTPAHAALTNSPPVSLLVKPMSRPLPVWP